MVKILFHHIPKTGGTSLNSYLSSLFPPEEVWTTEFIENERRFIKETVGQNGIKYSDYRWDYYCEKFSFMADHFNMIMAVPQDVIVLTFLRDPIARTVSQYKDWGRLTLADIENNPPQVKEAKAAAMNLDIHELINMDNPVIKKNFHNLQCKSLLLDANPEHKVNVYSDEELLHHAKTVMNRVNFVGITEYMLESVNRFLSKVGFEVIQSLNHLNATSQSISLSKTDISEISRFNQADIELYNEYLDKFKQNLN